MNDNPSAPVHKGGDQRNDNATRFEKRLEPAVILAALAAVPATFLTAMDGAAATTGQVINYLSLAVLVGESAVPVFLAGDRWGWIKEHWVPIAVVAASIPAVILAIGPAQVLRLVRHAGALRILRVHRILRAGRVLRNRLGLTDWKWKMLLGVVAMLAAAFVAVVLADPTSFSRQLVERGMDRFGWPAILLAGAILAGATYLVVRYRDRSSSESD